MLAIHGSLLCFWQRPVLDLVHSAVQADQAVVPMRPSALEDHRQVSRFHLTRLLGMRFAQRAKAFEIKGITG